MERNTKINLCSKLLPKVKEIMRSNYSCEERQKIVEELQVRLNENIDWNTIRLMEEESK